MISIISDEPEVSELLIVQPSYEGSPQILFQTFKNGSPRTKALLNIDQAAEVVAELSLLIQRMKYESNNNVEEGDSL